MKLRAALLSLAVIVLTGCVLVDVLLFPFKLLFELIGGIGSGIGSVLGAVAVVEPCEGSRPETMPTVQMLEDGRVLVAAPSRPDPFRIRFSAPGCEEVVMTWPADFPGAAAATGSGDVALAAGDSTPVIRVMLEAQAAR